MHARSELLQAFGPTHATLIRACFVAGVALTALTRSTQGVTGLLGL